ncbi:MAG: NAD-dependent epimerase/dehydratase family protein [Nitriliruptoraceae bacterium]|nr:NAD-dependent epimerase/dehydratase family protein [Nitriliruptoraceae bacterium]
MSASRRVLITGISGQLAGLVARALEQRDEVLEIVGIDVKEPKHDLRRTEFVRADIRNPVVARVLEAAAIDTVLHLSTIAAPGSTGGRAGMKERNVIGAMQLLAACQRAPRLKRFVLKSTTAVYGSDHTDPGAFREEAAPRGSVTHGFAKDATEVEGYVRALGRRRKDVDVTVLRLANLLGPHLDSAFHSLFSLPVVPTVLGFDPRLQFLHEQDAVEVLERATVEDHPGIFNVAGEGVLYLSQCVRLAGRIPAPVPLPLVSAVAGAVRRSKRADVSPEQLRFLQFGRVVDLTALRERFGFQPRFTSAAAFEDFVAQRRLQGTIGTSDVVRWERELQQFLQRKGQERFLDRQRAEPRR